MFETLLGGIGGGSAPPITITDTWRKVGNLNEAVNGASLVVIGSKLYLYGGQGSDFIPHGKVWEIDIATGTVVAKAAGPARRYHKAFVYQGKMWAYGGYGSGGYTGQVSVYDPVANSWNSLANPGILCDRYSQAFINNKLYVVGGLNGSPISQPRIYDPVTNDWANFNATSGPLLPGDYLGSADYIDGKMYILYGYSNPGVFTAYDPISGVNLAKASPVSSRYEHTSGAMKKGIYLFSGTTAIAGVGDKTTRYNILTDTWEYLSNVPVSYGGRSASAQDASHIYLAGGSTGNLSVYEYTP